jgi:hypothetical protein
VSDSSKHGPRLDDQLKREVEGHLVGSSAGSRVEEWREPQPPVDGEPEVSAVPQPDSRSRSDVALDMTPDEIEGRSRLGRYLRRTVFPADRARLREAARQAQAPDDVLSELERLPAGETYETVARVWAALGHDLDRRF